MALYGVAATFSVAARDEVTGMLGVAVASKALAVGATCPFAQADIGAICSQAYSNPNLGVLGLDLLSKGFTAEQTLHMLLARDEGRDWRQVNIVDNSGESAAFTGSRTDPWSGTRNGLNYALGGNLLVSEETVKRMEETFLATSGLEFGERLLHVLEAGDAAGGDVRGKQSAAIYIVYRQPFPYLNLRVDDHREPINELRRIFDLTQGDYLANRLRLADALQPRSIEENIILQRSIRHQLRIPITE